MSELLLLLILALIFIFTPDTYIGSKYRLSVYLICNNRYRPWKTHIGRPLIQIIFTSSIRNRDDTCFRCWSRLDALVSFPVTSTCWLRSLLRVSRGQFVLLRWKLCCLASLSRDVTGKALLCSAVVEFVAPWCYGFGTVLDFFRWWFRGERPADRRALEGAVAKAGSVASRSSREFRDSRDVQAMFKRKRARTLARRFKLSVFGHRPQAAGPIRALVRGGAPPARLLLQGTFMWRKITFTPVLKLLPGLHIYNITTFVILLIHTFLQPFVQV